MLIAFACIIVVLTALPHTHTHTHTHTQPIEFIDSLATKPDYVFKILVVGNSFVGKSSYLFRMCNNAFSQRYSSTIGEHCVCDCVCVCS